jgi:hypothetical protein
VRKIGSRAAVETPTNVPQSEDAELIPPCRIIANRMLPPVLLFVAIGFALALGVPLVLTLVYVALPLTGGRVVVQVVIQTVEIAGLLCVIYGLRV